MAKKGVRSAYATTPAAAAEGVWQDLKNGIRVRVRYEQSVPVQETARLLDKKYRSILLTEGGLPPEIQLKRDAELCATAILTDWEGVTEDDGTVIPFSPAKARELFLDPTLGDFLRDVIYASRVSENFRAAEQAALSGNSPALSEAPSV